MIAVIFEVTLAPGKRDEYLAIATSLRSAVEKIDGFISIERFSSVTNEGKLLSLSYWRDEDALEQWRAVEAHRAAQTSGRKELFSDYRLRIANIERDYGMHDRDQAPRDSREFHG